MTQREHWKHVALHSFSPRRCGCRFNLAALPEERHMTHLPRMTEDECYTVLDLTNSEAKDIVMEVTQRTEWVYYSCEGCYKTCHWKNTNKSSDTGGRGWKCCGNGYNFEEGKWLDDKKNWWLPPIAEGNEGEDDAVSVSSSVQKKSNTKPESPKKGNHGNSSSSVVPPAPSRCKTLAQIQEENKTSVSSEGKKQDEEKQGASSQAVVTPSHDLREESRNLPDCCARSARTLVNKFTASASGGGQVNTNEQQHVAPQSSIQAVASHHQQVQTNQFQQSLPPPQHFGMAAEYQRAAMFQPQYNQAVQQPMFHQPVFQQPMVQPFMQPQVMIPHQPQPQAQQFIYPTPMDITNTPQNTISGQPAQQQNPYGNFQ